MAAIVREEDEMTPELTRIMHDWRQLLFVPSSLLCYGVTKMWNHYRGRH